MEAQIYGSPRCFDCIWNETPSPAPARTPHSNRAEVDAVLEAWGPAAWHTGYCFAFAAGHQCRDDGPEGLKCLRQHGPSDPRLEEGEKGGGKGAGIIYRI